MSHNEIYLLIKYIKSVLWRVAKRLSYIEDARCLKVKNQELVIWLPATFQNDHYAQFDTETVSAGSQPHDDET